MGAAGRGRQRTREPGRTRTSGAWAEASLEGGASAHGLR